MAEQGAADRVVVRSGRTTRGRRPAALLVALALGGVLAGVLGLPGTAPAGATEGVAVAEDVAVAEALAASEDSGFEADTMPQMAITEAQAQQRLAEVAASRAQRDAEAAAAAEAARPKAVLPVDGARMTTCFCMRWGQMHYGIDLAAPMLTPEYAAEDGVVVRAGAAGGYGQAVYILGVSGDVTVYGHMEEIEVSAGDVVEAGQTIALLGSRGQSTGPHLHFEVHSGGINGRPVDPVEWLAERGVEV
ncbi:M23 family metallopeptidase [Klenkia sp. PcliD-1-E]|uniref:M23 family metallopeptidase n=1 Tax=Klenkia sp. PcliD-1-E TaxID=2954492 RepID=UPI00209710B9|nr:M23 family metallopeptidase [Klenkia sp. PcliD-1-E]MCO7222418.1 M23 family metallopeptidase [Klenkia sp. PcliD-1-E]